VIPRAVHRDGVAPQARCKSFTFVKSQAPGTTAYGAKRPFMRHVAETTRSGCSLSWYKAWEYEFHALRGEQQGGGQKPGQQQQDPNRQDQNPNQQGKGGR
jgi:hypothetical protein